MFTQKHIWLLYILPCIFSLLLINVSYPQESQNPLLLFEYDRTYMRTAVQKSYELERNYITMNREISPSQHEEGDRITIELNGSVQEFSVMRATSYVDGTYSISAKGGTSGRDQLLITFEEDRMVGSIVTGEAFGHYHIRHDIEQGRTYIAKVDPSRLDHLPCGLDGDECPTHHVTGTGIGNNEKVHSPNLSAMASTLTELITIDLMIVYTDAAEEWANNSGFGSINAVIAEAMNLSQTALDNSDVYIDLRLVHIHKTEYDEDTADTGGIHLRRFTASPDYNPYGDDFNGYMEEIHTLRNQYGADLLALFASEPKTGGIAWLLNSASGRPEIGFSVNRVQQVATGYTLIHEIGHNLGNAHARGQTNASAGLVGGVFEYSTGFRWEGSSESYTTVMGYVEGKYSRIPLFSNPDILWGNHPAGTYTGLHGPSDNARSMREIKAAVANYRPTMVDPPSISTSGNVIHVSMDREDTYTVPVTIMNVGASDLMWNIDFEPNTGHIAKSAVPTGSGAYQTLDASSFDSEVIYAGENIRGGALFTSADTDDSIVLSTSFSNSEGFSTGKYSASRLWRTSNDNMKFEISDENPAVGNKHMRIAFDASVDTWQRVESPYFGPQPFGAFEFSVDISFENMVSNDDFESFQITLFDASDNIAAGILFANSYIYIRQRDESGGTVYRTSFDQYNIDDYNLVQIIADPDEGKMHYYFDEDHIRSVEYISGKKFDYLRFSYRNNVPGMYIDIDNIQVKRYYDPFQWLNISRYGGVARAGGSSELLLEFSTVGIVAGEYTSNMLVRSNDPDVPAIVIPVKLQVSNVVTVDDQPDIPFEFALLQNYPNPFNPATTITFRVPEAGQVRLEVYDIVGRRISLLIDDEVMPGEHQIAFDGTGLSSGMYIYRLTSSAGTLNKKMVVTK